VEAAHFCSCVEEDPATYSALLAAADMVNAQINSNTVTFLKAKGLWTGDFDAAFMVEKNGQSITKIWCSHRTRAVTAARDEYVAEVKKWVAPYEAALNRAHDAAQRQPPNNAPQGMPRKLGNHGR
jgi:hypothetical protein